MDVADARSVHASLESHRPWAVVNAAVHARLDDAEEDAERCRRKNGDGSAVLAAACERAGITLLTVSRGLELDGAEGATEIEHDVPRSVRGGARAGEKARVLEAAPFALAVRTGEFFEFWNAHAFAFRPILDEPRGASPLMQVSELVHAALDLLIDRACGGRLNNPFNDVRREREARPSSTCESTK